MTLDRAHLIFPRQRRRRPPVAQHLGNVADPAGSFGTAQQDVPGPRAEEIFSCGPEPVENAAPYNRGLEVVDRKRHLRRPVRLEERRVPGLAVL